MQMNGALPQAYPHIAHHKVNKASDYACVVFIFIFSFGYSVGFGPNAWVYGTEVFPTYVRSKGLNLAASAGAIGSIVVAQVWPVAIANIGSKTYFIFMSINIACLIVSCGQGLFKSRVLIYRSSSSFSTRKQRARLWKRWIACLGD